MKSFDNNLITTSFDMITTCLKVIWEHNTLITTSFENPQSKMSQKQSYESYQIPANTIMLAANKTHETKQNILKLKITQNGDKPSSRWETYRNYSICLFKVSREIEVNVMKLTVPRNSVWESWSLSLPMKSYQAN